MRSLAAIVALCVVCACSPPAQQPEISDDTIAGETQTDPLAAALTPVLAEDIGLPVSLAVTTSTTDGDWGWLIAQPWTPEGAAIDWSQTRHAARAAEGALDGAGTTYALLRRQNGQWQVVEFAVGPTDAAWADWAERHGAPASLMRTD